MATDHSPPRQNVPAELTPAAVPSARKRSITFSSQLPPAGYQANLRRVVQPSSTCGNGGWIWVEYHLGVPARHPGVPGGDCPKCGSPEVECPIVDPRDFFDKWGSRGCRLGARLGPRRRRDDRGSQRRRHGTTTMDPPAPHSRIFTVCRPTQPRRRASSAACTVLGSRALGASNRAGGAITGRHCSFSSGVVVCVSSTGRPSYGTGWGELGSRAQSSSSEPHRFGVA